MGYRKAVFVVVYSKKNKKIEYLILRREHHWRGWEFPKGGLNQGENKRQAVIRETKEETGLKPIKIKRFNFSGRYKYKKRFGDRTGIIGQTFSLYAVEVKKGRIKFDNNEHSGFKWANFKEAIEKMKFTNQKKSLKIVDDWLKNGI